MSNKVLEAFYGLGRNLNKLRGKAEEETTEGIVSEKFPELSLDMANEDILKLTGKWSKVWEESDAKAKWLKHIEENENYWLGKHFQRPEVDKTRALIDNVIFESLETYLPQVTRRNPEPMVVLKRGEQEVEESLKYCTEMQKELGEIADEQNLRLKLKKAARHWAIYHIGVAKLGWDMQKDIPTSKIVRPKKLILDPEATVDEDGYTGDYIGEHRKLKASQIIGILQNVGGEPEAEKVITDLVKDDLATEIAFVEWWTDEYLCWTLDEHVLLKKKNPHWNYDSETAAPADPVTGQTPMGPDGAPMTIPKPGFNHLPVSQKPYLFLSVFNLGKQPMDDTSLIAQNLSNQDIINKRVKQIDKNADSMNGGMVVSQERSGLTQQQAKGVTEALRKGGTIIIPQGSVNDAVARMSAPGLPNDVYNQLVDIRSRLRDIFGTRGSSAAGLETENTVRGKIMNRTLDTDRIGGGFSEYLEQFADAVYNWYVQLLYVYDTRYSSLAQKPKVKVSIKEGSLLPKDSTTVANQAIDLAGAGKMSVLDLYKRLDYPNPDEMAANVWLEANAPEILFGSDQRVQQVMAQRAAQQGAQTKPPSTSINLKDLPPDGQAQLAAQAGITLYPEAIAAFNKNQSVVKANERSALSQGQPTQEQPIQ
jgi:hypothetical protein